MTQSHRKAFLQVLRELAQTFQSFEQFSALHVRQLGLTPPQFDVIATLGNTTGMSCKELSKKTLITKGTLTGVLDRLEQKGIIQRCTKEQDRRSIFVALTKEGEHVFNSTFPAHGKYLETISSQFTEDELIHIRQTLGLLKDKFTDALEQQRT